MNIRGGFQELTIKLAADNGGAWNLMFETILRLLSTLSTRTELQRGAHFVNHDQEGHRWQHYTGRWEEAVVQIQIMNRV